jgi:hypothetical protein
LVQYKKKGNGDEDVTNNYTRYIGHLILYVRLTTTTKSGGLRWAGNIQITSSNDMPRRIMESKSEGRRSVGRPKPRWMDGVLEGLRTMGVKSWWMAAKDRKS